MSLPTFPDFIFDNTVSVKLCDDSGNTEGGFNPVAGSPNTFAVSVQERGTEWMDRGGAGVSVTRYAVYFQTDPTGSLGRAIRAGDQIEWGNEILSALGPVRDRGGLGFLWKLTCEQVAT